MIMIHMIFKIIIKEMAAHNHTHTHTLRYKNSIAAVNMYCTISSLVVSHLKNSWEISEFEAPDAF